MQLNSLAIFYFYGTGVKKYSGLATWLSRQVPRLLVLACMVVSAPALFAEQSGAQAEAPSVAKEITAIIAAKQHPFLMPSGFENRAEDLDALYKMASYSLLWLGNSHSEQNIAAVLALLANAQANGLQQSHYDVAALQRKKSAAMRLNTDDYQELARYDTALSLSLLRFLHDLHYGRISPQDIDFNLKLRKKKLIDLPALIKSAVDQETVALLPALVEPKLQQYQNLKAALAHYRELAVSTKPFEWAFTKPIRPGDNVPDIEALRHFLTLLGDFPVDQNAATATPSTRYGDKMVAAMKKFQRRHGLVADGVIGKTTAVELSTGFQPRALQIELAMERLRWLPELSAAPSIIVNIPAFQLWAPDDINALDASMTNMRVVVGKAMKNQTPVLMADMSFIDFAPYWNVPYNIVKDELIPKLSQNPGYLAKENMELVYKGGVVGFSGATIAGLKQGTIRVRQRPGKKNALGRVKFLFPNKDDVYLHDTPANALFSRTRRDLSHGCVRVANPEKLAEFALKNQPGWDKERIQQAMRSPKMQRVILKTPIPVLFFYTTAFFDQDNQLVFYPDIYNHDVVLQEALKKSGDLSDQVLFADLNDAAKLKEEQERQQEEPSLSNNETIKPIEISK
jgi:murein L,D-transpeptidase YcbB/YkuD